MAIEGLDISHYQGFLTKEQVQKMKAAGIKFVYHKFSQGVNFKDKCAEHNTTLLQDGGIGVGPYHFVTNDNAIRQYEWFVKCMGNFKFEFPPAMDCEAFTVVNNNLYAERELIFIEQAKTNFIADSMIDKKFRAIPAQNAFVVGSAYMLTYPNKDIIDVIGKRLKDWMKNFPKLSKYPQPSIYTNKASGDRIFDMSAVSWAKYLLWVANWGVPSPTLPNIWKGRPYFIWQNYVGSGKPYNIDGNVDHDVWGNYMPFPETAAPSASPSASPSEVYADTVETILKFKDGSSYAGTLEGEI